MWLLHCRDYPRTAFHVNIEGTFNVLEACVKNNIKRLVTLCTSVYGDAAEVPMTESHPFNNRNFYGATKIAGEAMCRAYYDRYGLDYVGLRYMNVYGPRQDQHAVYSGVIPIMLNNIDAGKAPTVMGMDRKRTILFMWKMWDVPISVRWSLIAQINSTMWARASRQPSRSYVTLF